MREEIGAFGLDLFFFVECYRHGELECLTPPKGKVGVLCRYLEKVDMTQRSFVTDGERGGEGRGGNLNVMCDDLQAP